MDASLRVHPPWINEIWAKILIIRHGRGYVRGATREFATYLAQREEDTLKERSRLVQASLQCIIEMNIEFTPMISYVFPHVREHNALKEDSRLFRFKI